MRIRAHAVTAAISLGAETRRGAIIIIIGRSKHAAAEAAFAPRRAGPAARDKDEKHACVYRYTEQPVRHAERSTEDVLKQSA